MIDHEFITFDFVSIVPSIIDEKVEQTDHEGEQKHEEYPHEFDDVFDHFPQGNLKRTCREVGGVKLGGISQSCYF